MYGLLVGKATWMNLLNLESSGFRNTLGKYKSSCILLRTYYKVNVLCISELVLGNNEEK